MKNRLKVLRIITSLDPKFGGPQNGIFSSSEQLIKEGFKVDIITCDNKKFINREHKNIKIINLRSFVGQNYRFSLKLFLWLFKNKQNYDFFIVHGIWQFNTLIARLLLKKNYFVFTHGQLDPFFSENLYTKIKKQLYWYLIEKKNLINSRSILLTSVGEKKLLQKTYVDTNKIKKNVIKYGIIKKRLNRFECLKKFYSKFPFLKSKNFYLFLGRYNEKKGCDVIVNSVKKINKNFKSIILFAGPINGTKYENNIKKLINKNNLQKKIIFNDAIYNDLKWGAILASRGMLLASHGENFGVSIAESLSLGKPVLITDKVNIAKDILNYNAGLVSSNTVNSFSKKLNKFEQINKKQLIKISKNALKCFRDNYNLSSNKNSLGQLLKKELN